MIRRAILYRALLLPVVAVALVPLVLMACGSVSRAGWCAYHVARFAVDIHHHAHGWAALQALLATHHCRI